MTDWSCRTSVSGRSNRSNLARAKQALGILVRGLTNKGKNRVYTRRSVISTYLSEKLGFCVNSWVYEEKNRDVGFFSLKWWETKGIPAFYLILDRLVKKPKKSSVYPPGMDPVSTWDGHQQIVDHDPDFPDNIIDRMILLWESRRHIGNVQCDALASSGSLPDMMKSFRLRDEYRIWYDGRIARLPKFRTMPIWDIYLENRDLFFSDSNPDKIRNMHTSAFRNLFDVGWLANRPAPAVEPPPEPEDLFPEEELPKKLGIKPYKASFFHNNPWMGFAESVNTIEPQTGLTFNSERPEDDELSFFESGIPDEVLRAAELAAKRRLARNEPKPISGLDGTMVTGKGKFFPTVPSELNANLPFLRPYPSEPFKEMNDAYLANPDFDESRNRDEPFSLKRSNAISRRKNRKGSI